MYIDESEKQFLKVMWNSGTVVSEGIFGVSRNFHQDLMQASKHLSG